MGTEFLGKTTRPGLLLGIILPLLSCLPVNAADLPAFPGAEGFGAGAKGGRGGKVFVVTTLEDYPGGKKKAVADSLRAACEAKGPRTIVFDVAGTIVLEKALRISEPYITIAGQTPMTAINLVCMTPRNAASASTAENPDMANQYRSANVGLTSV